jgi:hypothetical protein
LFILVVKNKMMSSSLPKGFTAVPHDTHASGSHLQPHQHQHNLDFNADENDSKMNQNWYELRVAGKCPERRAYHSTFTHGKK